MATTFFHLATENKIQLPVGACLKKLILDPDCNLLCMLPNTSQMMLKLWKEQKHCIWACSYHILTTFLWSVTEQIHTTTQNLLVLENKETKIIAHEVMYGYVLQSKNQKKCKNNLITIWYRGEISILCPNTENNTILEELTHCNHFQGVQLCTVGVKTWTPPRKLQILPLERKSVFVQRISNISMGKRMRRVPLLHTPGGRRTSTT